MSEKKRIKVGDGFDSIDFIVLLVYINQNINKKINVIYLWYTNQYFYILTNKVVFKLLSHIWIYVTVFPCPKVR